MGGPRLNCISWNVAGWSEFKATVLHNNLKGLHTMVDAIALQEVITVEQCRIPGFTMYTTARQGRGAGRGGGIVLGINESWEILEAITEEYFVAAAITRL